MPHSKRPRRRRRPDGAATFQAAIALTLTALAVVASSPERVFRMGVAAFYPESEPAPAPTDATVAVGFDTSRVKARVRPEFLSFSLDTSLVMGGRWWSPEAEVEWPTGQTRVDPLRLDRPELVELTRALAPAFLRVGGTEADDVYYAEGTEPTPSGYGLRLERNQWDELVSFVRATDTRLVFTLNAGPGPRVTGKGWQPDNAARLIRRAERQRAPVAVWELGNEVNAYWITHGPLNRVDAAQYGRDLANLHELVAKHTPLARIAGPGLVVWPRIGEPPRRQLREFLSEAGEALDIVTWHYYPQQSRRCPVASRRASPETALQPRVLDEVDRWAAYVESARDAELPNAEIWLDESGGAQCGGEPGLSDRYASSLWWLDQLGKLAARGQQVVVRQALLGSHYGMLDDRSLKPRPDFYASVLFKSLMGSTVLHAYSQTPARHVRAYAHCTPAEAGHPPGAVTLLWVHLREDAATSLRFENPPGAALVYQATATTKAARDVQLNGQTLTSKHVHELPALGARRVLSREVRVPPLSYTFVVLPEAHAEACR